MQDLNLEFGYSSEDSTVTITDRVTRREIGCKQVIAMTGRMTTDGSNCLARTPKGGFYTPVLAEENGRICSVHNETFFSGDGKSQLKLPACTRTPSRRAVILPTLVNNADPKGPKYVNLIAYGENAMKLATTTKGSSVTAIGEPSECKVGAESFNVLLVRILLHNKKGGVKYDSLQ